MSQPKDSKFRTHIKEPRWQQAASLVVAVVLVLLWLGWVIVSR